MAAKGKRASKTNVYWSKDRILFRHFSNLIYMFSSHSVFNELLERKGSLVY